VLSLIIDAPDQVNQGMAGGMRFEHFAVHRDAAGTVHLPIWNNHQRIVDAMVTMWGEPVPLRRGFHCAGDQLSAELRILPCAQGDAADLAASQLEADFGRHVREDAHPVQDHLAPHPAIQNRNRDLASRKVSEGTSIGPEDALNLEPSSGADSAGQVSVDGSSLRWRWALSASIS
jgi:hypothetical protein